MSTKSKMVKAVSALTAMSVVACASMTGFAATYTTTTEYVLGNNTVNAKTTVTGVQKDEQVTYLVHNDNDGTIADGDIIYINQDGGKTDGTATFSYQTTTTKINGLHSTVLVGAATSSITAPSAENQTIDSKLVSVTKKTNGSDYTAGGTVSIADSTAIGNGQKIDFTVTPTAGYVPTVTVDGVEQAPVEGVYSVTGAGAAIAIVVNFVESKPYIVNVQKDANGTVSIANNTPLGTSETIKFTAVPDPYYKCTVSIDGVEQTKDVDGYYSITGNGNTPRVIVVNFVKPYTISVAAYNVDQGTVTLNSAVLGVNEEVGYKVEPKTGFEIDTILVNGVGQTLNGTTYSVIGTENKTITVTFKAIQGESGVSDGTAPSKHIDADATKNAITTFGAVSIAEEDQAKTIEYGILFATGEKTEAQMVYGNEGVDAYKSLGQGTAGKFSVVLVDGGSNLITDQVYTTRTYLLIDGQVKKYGAVKVVNQVD